MQQVFSAAERDNHDAADLEMVGKEVEQGVALLLRQVGQQRPCENHVIVWCLDVAERRLGLDTDSRDSVAAQ